MYLTYIPLESSDGHEISTLKKCPSTMKQRRSVHPYKEVSFTSNITTFATERSSFLKIHGTSPSLKDQEEPTSPLLVFLSQCPFLVFKEIRSLLTNNVSFFFYDMFLYKEDETFLNMCMGSNKWKILIFSQYGSS